MFKSDGAVADLVLGTMEVQCLELFNKHHINRVVFDSFLLFSFFFFFFAIKRQMDFDSSVGEL